MNQVSNSPHRMSLSAQKAIDFYVSESQNLNKNCKNEVVKSERLKAQKHFMQQGLPSRRDENWQYTPLTQFLKQKFSIKGVSHISLDQIKGFFPSFVVIHLVFVDGSFSDELSDSLSSLPKGLVIETTADLLEMSDDALQVSLDSESLEKEPFAVLNTMFVKDGFNIDVAKHADIEIPIFVLHVQTQQGHASVLRNRVRVGENAALTLIEHSVSIEEDTVGFTNFVTEFDLAASSRMKQLIIQEENLASYHFSNQFIKQGEKSLFETLYINLGGQLSRHQNSVVLVGEHCETSQNSLCHGQGNQIIDSRTEVNHALPHGQSNQLHKFVLRDKSRGVFNGMIKVAKDAQKTDGQMDNKNILLSTEARMDVKPQLEIYADDVKCSHGSASGQIDDNQVFYLQARGIRKADAIKLITQAFLLEPLQSISNKKIRDWAEIKVKQSLEVFA